jgi:hypothetical protein
MKRLAILLLTIALAIPVVAQDMGEVISGTTTITVELSGGTGELLFRTLNDEVVRFPLPTKKVVEQLKVAITKPGHYQGTDEAKKALKENFEVVVTEVKSGDATFQGLRSNRTVGEGKSKVNQKLVYYRILNGKKSVDVSPDSRKFKGLLDRAKRHLPAI